MYLSSLWLFVSILIYTVVLYIFGGYIGFIEILDIFNCFLNNKFNKLEPVFDYIVVGCGSAGSVVASRLTTNKNVTVLVLEAGPHGSRILDIPAFGPILHKSVIDWQYRTVPQKNASKGFYQHANNWPMGRIVGGTGRINNMIYVRGHPFDYYEWFKGSEEFNYETDVLDFFKKSEDQQGTYKNDTKYHSTGGPLVVEDLRFTSDLGLAVLEAATLLKYPIRDLNSAGNSGTGFMASQVNINYGDRWTPAYYMTKQNKPNLVLQTNSLVTKVLLKANFEAYAVKFVHLGKTSFVRARKGIILSAGVIGTPKLLMLSGIGPQKHLDEIGIKNKINLPVGDNLQDHVTTGLDLITLNVSLGMNLKSLLSPIPIFKYFTSSSGPFTTAGCEVVGLVNTNDEKICNKLNKSKQFSDELEHDDAPHSISSKTFKNSIKTCSINETSQPDLQFMVLPLGISTDGGIHFWKALGISDVTWKKYFSRLVGETAISILPIVLHPKSRGTVRLNSNNVYNHPLIDPNYLSVSYDVHLLVTGINFIKRLIDTEPLQKLGAQLNKQKFPGCEHHTFDTPTYWECYVRHLTVTSFHPAGTCKMGHKSDKSVVVDYNFQVLRTHKLYVVDASVMPTLPSGNINAAVIMLAEKAAAEIQNQLFLNSKACYIKEIFVYKKICKLK